MKHIRNDKNSGIWFCPVKQIEVTGPKLLKSMSEPDPVICHQQNEKIFNRTWHQISSMQQNNSCLQG